MNLHYIVQLVSKGRGSGKTSVGTKIVEGLKRRGITVAVVKHSIHESIDLAGKDTHRYFQAGADYIVFSSNQQEVHIVRKPHGDLKTIASQIPLSYYIVLVEGFKGEDADYRVYVLSEDENVTDINMNVYDKVVVMKDRGALQGLKTININDIDLIVDEIIVKAEEKIYKTLPKANCRYCGFETCNDMARAILRGSRTFADCPLLIDMKLYVNGKMLPLSPYPKMVFEKVVKALVSTLKGSPDSIEHVIIEYKVKGER